MAQNTNSFNVVGLDFADTKLALQEFLQSQNTLKDYNFDGSILNTILDVLAYNTHYQSFYANMVANEMFLDSAVLRPSIVSHAKQLGYCPQSARAACAVLTVPVASGQVSSNTYLSVGSEFTGTDAEGTQYKFILLDNVYGDETTKSFQNIKVYEGSLRRMSYIYDRDRKMGNLLLIPNDKIDTTTIRVRVQASVTDTEGANDSWSEATSYIDLKPTSTVYFLQEREYGMYELYFGDNFFGKQPETGNVVNIEYMETNGADANNIDTFSCTIANTGVVQVVSSSFGGGDVESESRIKFLAPKYYKSQSRAVTQGDYIATVFREYPNAGSVYVYGGETTTPPQYGKIFIAIKPKAGSALSTSEKSSLVKRLRDTASVVSIIPEIVDTDYIDLIVDSKVTYNPSVLNVSPGTLKAFIVAYAFSFSNTIVGTFGSNFYYSKFTQGLNALHASILSNETSVSLRKTISVGNIIASKGFVVDFGNSLYHPNDGHISVVSSNSFPHKDSTQTIVYGCVLSDNGYGVLNVIKNEIDGSVTVVAKGVGIVDYAAGTIRMGSTFIPQIPSNIVYGITITVQPKNQDLFVKENRVIRINRGYGDSVSVRLETESAASSTSSM